MTVEGISSEVRPPLAVGKDVVVLSHMIEEVDFGEGPVYLVLENHVHGIVGYKKCKTMPTKNVGL